MANIQSLAKELLIRILQEVTIGKDLKSLRFVNKSISILVTAQLFHTIFVRFRRDDLSRLITIATDPILRAHVKEISYDIDGPLEAYWNTTETTHLPGPTTPHGEIPNHRWALSCLLDEASRLAYAITHLPNVIALRLVESTGQWHDLNPDDDTNSSVLGEHLPEDLRGFGVRSLVAMMRVASITTTDITTLEVSNRRHGLHYSFLNLTGPDMYHTFTMFANLTHIGIYINTSGGESESQVLLRGGILSELLMTASHLRQLSLGFDQRPDEDVRLAQILGSRRWKGLRKLDIMALDFHYEEMEKFLRQHPDLTEFKIANSRLHSGSLRQMFELVHTQLPQLKTVGLDGALGDATSEFSFLQFSENQRLGKKFLLGDGLYPRFQADGQEGR